MNGEVGTGKPSGLENRGTVTSDGSSSLPLSAKELVEKMSPDELEIIIRQVRMKKFMSTGWRTPEFWQRVKNY